MAVVIAAAFSLESNRWNLAAQEGTNDYVITCDGLGVVNSNAVPDPYPGIDAATVTHFGREQNGTAFEDVLFWSRVGPGNGYGNLTNVARGPSGTPASTPAWGGIRITPNYPNHFIRLKSLDLAALDDNNVDETVAIAVWRIRQTFFRTSWRCRGTLTMGLTPISHLGAARW